MKFGVVAATARVAGRVAVFSREEFLSGVVFIRVRRVLKKKK